MDLDKRHAYISIDKILTKVDETLVKQEKHDKILKNVLKELKEINEKLDGIENDTRYARYN